MTLKAIAGTLLSLLLLPPGAALAQSTSTSKAPTFASKAPNGSTGITASLTNTQYTYQDLGTLGVFSEALNVNGRGMVVGAYTLADYLTEHAFLWSTASGMHDLGNLGGILCTAFDLNQDGSVVVGYSELPDRHDHAFVWTEATGMQDIGTLPGDTDSLAYAINSGGEVIGLSFHQTTPGNFVQHGFKWTKGQGMTSFPAESIGNFGLNRRGQIAGVGPASGSYWADAWIWDAKGNGIELGSFGGGGALAAAVNDHGHVAGRGAYGPNATIWHSFYWTPETGGYDIGTFSGQAGSAASYYAWGMNNSDQVVGTDSYTGAFLWSPTNGMQDLSGIVPEWTIFDARAINRWGQIAATGYGPIGPYYIHAFVLTPQGR